MALALETDLPLCGAIRPFDGVTVCNESKDHEYDHHDRGRPFIEDGATVTPFLATWGQDGTETCAHCGYRLDDRGMCMAPLSVAD